VDRYAALYDGRAYLPKDEIEPVRRTVRGLVAGLELRDRRAVRLEPGPDPEQLAFPLAPGVAPARLVPPGA
jgi:hypothetical protein